MNPRLKPCRPWVVLLVAGLHMLAAAVARGSPQPAESLEWQVADSDLIVRGIVLSVEPAAGDVRFPRLTVRVLETIKGPRHDELSIVEPAARYVRDHQGKEVVLFLVRRDGPRPVEALIPRSPQHQSESVYVLRQFLRSVFPLDAEGERRLITMDWKVLRDPQEVLAALRQAALEEGESTLLKPHYVSGPRFPTDDSPHVSPADVGSLAIPVDHRLERRAREWTQRANPRDRARGAAALARFPSKQNASILQSLLSDAHYFDRRRATPWSKEYYVRRAAYEAMGKMGVPVPPTVLFEPDPAYRSLWPLMLVMGVVVSSLLIWTAYVLWRQKDERGAARLLRAGAIGFGIAAILVLVLDWRSRSVTHDALLMVGGSAHQFTSLAGRLRYAVVSDWPLPARPVYASLPPGAAWGYWKNVMYDSGRRSIAEWDRWGFGWLEVDVADPYQYRKRRSRAITVPHWVAAAMLGGIALVAVPAWLRTSRRVRQGLCRQCGYDLRASVGRCPECGGAITSPAGRSP